MSLQTPVDFKISNEVAIISLNYPPVNALAHTLRCVLKEVFDEAVNDQKISAIFITGNDRIFSAGADITEFETGDFWLTPNLPELCEHIESCPKLLIFGLNGLAMGGGLELALTGDYRLASQGALLGQPEVQLGIIPGAGGTQRLPRRIQSKAAIEMIISGKPITAERAYMLQLIDFITETESQEDFITTSLDYIYSLIASKAKKRRCPNESMTEELTSEDLAEYRESKSIGKRILHAHEQALRAIEAAQRLPFSEGLKYEQDLFRDCLETSQHRALKHLFFAERESKKIPGVKRDESLRRVESVGVVGAGTMGGGIAMSFLAVDIPVTLIDVSTEALEKGLDNIRGNYNFIVDRGKLTAEDAEKQQALLKTTTSFDALKNVDLVIEAVYEKLDLKETIFKELDRTCKTGTILATNTSTLDVNKIAMCTSRPGDVIGMHFFSPANVMQLLEVVRGDKTKADVISSVLQIGRKIKKLPIVVGVCHGFVGNRMMEPYIREAQRLVLEGADPADIDRVLTEFGMAMGPISVLDLIGLDVIYLMREDIRSSFTIDITYAALGDALYSLNRYGRKTGRGFYIYEGRNKQVDPEVITMTKNIAKEHKIVRRQFDDKEILERCLYPLINEGARILAEGIAYRSGDIDLVYTKGYGFPEWRGGPMHYAGEVGLNVVLKSLEHYQESLGPYGNMWFQSSPLLKNLAENEMAFKDYNESMVNEA